jgi:hypothetical protein
VTATELVDAFIDFALGCGYYRESLVEVFAEYIDDEPEQHCLEAMDPSDEAAEILDYYAALSAQHQGGAVFHSNSSPLVERVAATLHAVTDTDPNVPPGEWEPEARAAIREVAAWLDANSGGTRAAWMLMQAADEP